MSSIRTGSTPCLLRVERKFGPFFYAEAVRLWYSIISAGGQPRLAIIASEDHLTMAVVAGSFDGLPGRVERWLRATTVTLRRRADGPSRWGPADLRALHSRLMYDFESGIRLIEMTEPELTTCSLEMALGIMEAHLGHGVNRDEELTAA